MRALMHRRLRRDEGGYTGLVEMVTVIFLLALILATVYSTIFSTQNTVIGDTQRLQNLDEARTIMAVLTKDTRTAVRLQAGTSPFILADKNEAIFYANLNTSDAPKKVHIFIDSSSQLKEEVWAGTGTKPNYTFPGSPKTRLVGRYVANDASNPIFEYFDDDGNVLPAPLSASDLLAVNGVRITLRVKKTRSAPSVATTTVINRVRLPNQDYDAIAGGG
jgi:hypothetical protein